MTANQFRKLALQLPEAVESAHCGHPDFRVANMVFASLHPDGSTGNVKLTPEQQGECLRTAPKVFSPCAGMWGVRGYTQITLKPASVKTVRSVLLLAWRNTAPKKLLEE